jgi:sugar O-acyltransferase (sialic acid O-acetyltransferase NeuD family)
MRASIVGFGELGKQYFNFLKEDKSYTDFIFFDDLAKENNEENVFSFPDHLLDNYSDTAFFVSLGYKHLALKYQLLMKLKQINRITPSFIHSSCFVSNSAFVSDAAFLYPLCNVDKNVSIGLGTLLNNSVIVSHDSVIGNCCYLSPGVVVSGNVNIGDFTFIGSGSIISNSVSIGRNVNIGVGSVITKDIPDNSFVIGNPMRILTKGFTIL